MRVLIATLASPGFVFSSLAVAEALRARGHRVAFVTDAAYADALAARGFARLPNGADDAPSFQLDGWFDPQRIATQVRHLAAALRAQTPDVVLASNLAMGPLLVRRLVPVPVAVLGPMVLLWPSLRPSDDPADAEIEGRLAWRHADQMRHLTRAADALGIVLPDHGYERSPLFGDRYLLQGVPALQRLRDALPPAVRFAGPCTFDAPGHDGVEETAWIARQRAHGRRIVYVQLGRVFDKPSFWDAFRRRLERLDVAAVVCTERFDGVLDGVPENALVRARVAQDAVLPHADAVLCAGHPTAVLGALAHGVPLGIAPAGSGTEENAEACVRGGAAVEIDAADGDAVPRALERLLHEPAFRAAARVLQREIAQHDGPASVCDELERLHAEPARAGDGALSGAVP
ncbi:MAG TPA: nucleotide disphospho-sugar-binding domain-containing protein [Candidatus Elarobacter sp.]|jgi:UDP:flavonoid glycosyltransferase YjiC (YdhE family)